MTRIGSETVTPAQWYKGIASELGRHFELRGKVNLKTWWQERVDLSPVKRLSEFIELVLLVEVGTPSTQTVLKAVLAWTNGQPFLTQKLCKLIRNSTAPIPPNAEAEWIEQLVRTQIITNWESQDEPEHLRTIRDRITKSQQSRQLLALYQQVWEQSEIEIANPPIERELLLSGIIIKHQNTLVVQNRIYASIFDRDWIDRQ